MSREGVSALDLSKLGSCYDTQLLAGWQQVLVAAQLPSLEDIRPED